MRPGVQQLFETLDPFFIFGVFTAGQKAYADFVISKIDPKDEYIKFRFYRDSCKPMNRWQVKDLNKVVKYFKDHKPGVFKDIADPLSRIVIIDNISESYQLQPNNGIKIRDWYGTDFVDKHLVNLTAFLLSVAESNVPDLRTEICKYYKMPSNKIVGGGTSIYKPSL